MKRIIVAALTLFTLSPLAQTPAASPFKSLSFLEGTWKAEGKGPGGTVTHGESTFSLELDKHVMARHSRTADCQAPSSFDCEHGDLLYIYEEATGAPLKAIFFDNEGHVLHYDVTTPSPTSVVFLTDPKQPGPRFKLSYEVKGNVMAGKFEMQMPGQTEWHAYLEWSGPKV